MFFKKSHINYAIILIPNGVLWGGVTELHRGGGGISLICAYDLMRYFVIG